MLHALARFGKAMLFGGFARFNLLFSFFGLMFQGVLLLWIVDVCDLINIKKGVLDIPGKKKTAANGLCH
jgi:hypothetical protein